MAMMANRTQQYRLLQRVLGLAVASFVGNGLSAPAAGQTAWKWPSSGHATSNATAEIPWDAVSKPVKVPSGISSSTQSVEPEHAGLTTGGKTAWSELTQVTQSPSSPESSTKKTSQSKQDTQPISLQTTRKSTGSTRPSPKSMTSLLSERRPSGLQNQPVPMQTIAISSSSNHRNATSQPTAQDRSHHDHRGTSEADGVASLIVEAGDVSAQTTTDSSGSNDVRKNASDVEQMTTQLRITDTESTSGSPNKPAVVQAVKPLADLIEASPDTEAIVGKPVGATMRSAPVGAMKIYETSSMTGPLTEPGKLFARLRVEDDFRQVPVASELAAQRTEPSGSHWGQTDKVWVCPAFEHQPLYFEQPNLERYGMGGHRMLQPVYSAAHFFGCVGMMPYKVLAQRPGECVSTLGNQRPGDCANYQRRPVRGTASLHK